MTQDETSASAEVKGSQTYQVRLVFRSGGLSRSCSCPVADLCKHMVALAIVWDKNRGIQLPTQQEVNDQAIPPPLINYSDVTKAYAQPITANLDIIRIAADELGNWSRPHAHLPKMPHFSDNLAEPVILQEVKTAWGEIKRWSHKSNYDPYFCAGEMIAAGCEVMRLIIKRATAAAAGESAKILRESQKFHYQLISLIDDSDGLHIFTEAHLEFLYQTIKKIKSQTYQTEINQLLQEFDRHRNDY